MMKNLLYKINRWFELNLGWLFVNGRNQQWYCNYLKEKYEDRTDLDIPHPTPKLKWWQKLIGAFKGRRY